MCRLELTGMGLVYGRDRSVLGSHGTALPGRERKCEPATPVVAQRLRHSSTLGLSVFGPQSNNEGEHHVPKQPMGAWLGTVRVGSGGWPGDLGGAAGTRHDREPPSQPDSWLDRPTQ